MTKQEKNFSIPRVYVAEEENRQQLNKPIFNMSGRIYYRKNTAVKVGWGATRGREGR